MADPANRNDPTYSSDPEHYVFVGGRWQYRESAASGNAPDPNADTKVKAETVGSLSPFSTAPFQVPQGAPGSELDTTAADEERSRLAVLLAQLRQQTETGGGAWEQALRTSTDATKNAATALAQSADTDVMEARNSMGEARAAADQRAAGQAELLREQTKQQAQGDLANALGTQATLDANQAENQASVRRGVMDASGLLKADADQKSKNFFEGLGNTLISALSQGKANNVLGGGGMSDGGEVPGKARVFGDHEANDVVPAMLSADEWVIPRSITMGPDPVGQTTAFVKGLMSQRELGKTAFDAGGSVPWKEGDPDPTVSNAPVSPFETPALQRAPTSWTGALIDSKQYDQTRKDVLENSDRLLASAQGKGPSVAGQQMKDATHNSIASALRANANRGAPGLATNATLAAGADIQNSAGDAASTVAGETSKAGQLFAQAIQRQRAQDQTFSSAQQKAQWRNTLSNLGLSLEKQNQLLNMLSAGGQGAMMAMQLFPALTGEQTGPAPSQFQRDYDQGAIDAAFDSPDSGPGDFSLPSGEGPQLAAFGGEIRGDEARRSKAFLDALRARS